MHAPALARRGPRRRSSGRSRSRRCAGCRGRERRLRRGGQSQGLPVDGRRGAFDLQDHLQHRTGHGRLLGVGADRRQAREADQRHRDPLGRHGDRGRALRPVERAGRAGEGRAASGERDGLAHAARAGARRRCGALVGLPRQAARRPARPLPGEVQGRHALRVHAVRAHRRAPGVPVLRRAGLQGHLRHHRRDPASDRGHLQRPGALGEVGREGADLHLRVRSNAADLELPGGRRRRPLLLRGPEAGEPHHGAGGDAARTAATRRVRRIHRAGADHLVRELLRRSLPVPEARSGGRARLRGRGDGERGRHLLPRPRPAARSEERLGPGAEAGGHRGGARDGAPVVRRPGHHEVVGRPLAQRGLRQPDGERERGRAAPQLAHLGSLPVRQRARLPPGLPQDDAPHPLRRRHRRGGQRRLRRHHLHQGAGLPAHARSSTSRPRPGRRASTTTWRRTPGGMRRRRTSGPRWRRPRSSRWPTSLRVGSSSPASRW